MGGWWSSEETPSHCGVWIEDNEREPIYVTVLLDEPTTDIEGIRARVARAVPWPVDCIRVAGTMAETTVRKKYALVGDELQKVVTGTSEYQMDFFLGRFDTPDVAARGDVFRLDWSTRLGEIRTNTGRPVDVASGEACGNMTLAMLRARGVGDWTYDTFMCRLVPV